MFAPVYKKTGAQQINYEINVDRKGFGKPDR